MCSRTSISPGLIFGILRYPLLMTAKQSSKSKNVAKLDFYLNNQRWYHKPLNHSTNQVLSDNTILMDTESQKDCRNIFRLQTCLILAIGTVNDLWIEVLMNTLLDTQCIKYWYVRYDSSVSHAPHDTAWSFCVLNTWLTSRFCRIDCFLVPKTKTA